MKVGILGGAFNPPHVGHLVCAQEAHFQLGLDRVLFVPTGRPPHREIEEDPGAEARLGLCELAVAGDERFEVSRLEVDRPGPSYTADTLEQLHEQAPGDELFLILGGDQAASLPTWHKPERVFELATVAAIPRTGWPRERVTVTTARLRGARDLRFLDMPRIDVSSSLVRHRAARGESIRYLVPDKVLEHIEANNLYGAAAVVAQAPGAGAD